MISSFIVTNYYYLILYKSIEKYVYEKNDWLLYKLGEIFELVNNIKMSSSNIFDKFSQLLAWVNKIYLTTKKKL